VAWLVVVKHTENRRSKQGDRLSGKPGNVGEFDSCQGNVREFVKCRGIVREKSCQGKCVLECECTFG